MPKNSEEEKIIDNFSKLQIINSKRFRANKDLLNAILDNEKKYTLEEIEELIKEFKKGKV